MYEGQANDVLREITIYQRQWIRPSISRKVWKVVHATCLSSNNDEMFTKWAFSDSSYLIRSNDGCKQKKNTNITSSEQCWLVSGWVSWAGKERSNFLLFLGWNTRVYNGSYARYSGFRLSQQWNIISPAKNWLRLHFAPNPFAYLMAF